MLIHTIRERWQTIRSEIATVDWPTTGGSTYDPPDDVNERFVAYMVDTDEAALDPINVSFASGINSLELRAHFKNATDTATMQIFAAREGELEVKMIAEVAWVAGTQKTAASTARYFGATATVTQYWGKTITESDRESGTGIATIHFDTMGYNRFWIGFDAISANDNVSIQYSGF